MEIKYSVVVADKELNILVNVDRMYFDGFVCVDFTIDSIKVITIKGDRINIPETSKLYEDIEFILFEDYEFIELISQAHEEEKIERAMDEQYENLVWCDE